MRSALDAYGLPMPQFKKIGGILASEMPVDEAALHAAIMAINDALSRDSVRNTLRALENPSACLQRIDYKLADKYHLVLKAEREEKVLKKRCSLKERISLTILLIDSRSQ